ncbi:MAG TPA: enoyl-CoA hydratase/isomerase family protein [Stellaceae bacterium]|nr:enoyl-CoA hydratase/isomerase family protein [Stellaceae bacterium]
MTGETDDILLERVGGIGLITLNRPKALNAFTHEMYLTLEPVLDAWNADPAVAAVVIRGTGGKAFCAGGDIRALWESGPGVKGKDDLKSRFFVDEYRVIRKVHHLSKPYVALIDGVTMGGGVGMSVNGRFRVATENTLFAMPETGIGMIPDVGGTRILRACPGRIGLYLGLTGARLKGGADLLHAGIATHFLPAERIPALLDALATAADAPATLERFSADPGPSALRDLQPAIDRCFGQPTLPAIIEALRAEPDAWAATALKAIERASPASLAMTFWQLHPRDPVTMEQSLALEYGLVQQVMEGHDFFEGVRAVLVDKDQSPKWQPASLAALDDATVGRIIAAAEASAKTLESLS